MSLFKKKINTAKIDWIPAVRSKHHFSEVYVCVRVHVCLCVRVCVRVRVCLFNFFFEESMRE